MGTIYFIGCRDCKVFRDLDKFSEIGWGANAENRSEIKAYTKKLEECGSMFRVALTLSFLWKHKTHNVTAFSEHEDHTWEEFLLDLPGEERYRNEESEVFWKERDV